jgi:hypothetical protein
LIPFVQKWSSTTPTPGFEIDEVWCGMVAGMGFGTAATAETVEFWKKTVSDVYKGDEGRKKVRMAVICLLERDGILLRLDSIKCPVHWLQVSCILAYPHHLRYMLIIGIGNGGRCLQQRTLRRADKTVHFFQGGKTQHC